MKTIFIACFILTTVCSVCFAQKQDDSQSETGADKVIAVVYDRKILMSEKNNLGGIIFGALLEQYIKDHNIQPTEEEVDAFINRQEKMESENKERWEQERKDIIKKLELKELTESERKSLASHLETLNRLLKPDLEVEKYRRENPAQVRQSHGEMAKGFIKMWKINKALFDQYGGRVIFQQAGPEPLDAYRSFLKEEEQKGTFKILDESFSKAFWKYFTDDSMHTFISSKPEEGTKIFNTPWWLADKASQKYE